MLPITEYLAAAIIQKVIKVLQLLIVNKLIYTVKVFNIFISKLLNKSKVIFSVRLSKYLFLTLPPPAPTPIKK